MNACVLAALSVLAAIDAPVTDVTVFSDRARVTRTATVELSGTRTLELAPLPDTIDASSLRVEADGARVVRVDLAPLLPQQMSGDQARTFLEQLAALDDRLALLSAQAQAYREEASAAQAIAPATPQAEPLRPLPRLDSSGWAQALTFISTRASKAEAAARDLDAQMKTLARKRQALAEQAQLAGGATRHGGWKVTPTLDGTGHATVRVTYLAGPARWTPSYDLQLQTDTGQVRVSFSGQVSQETTEDWSDALLTLSTAVPGTAVRMPELATWKIGEQDRFIPTPIAAPPQVVPMPPPPPPPPRVDIAELWRERLASRERSPVQADQDEANARAANGPFDKFGAIGGRGEAAGAIMTPPPAPPPPPKTYHRRPAQPVQTESSPPGAPAMAPAPEPVAQEEKAEEIDALAPAKPAPPTTGFNLAPPSVYVPPSYSPELPAAAAGGYDLAWTSLQRESVESGKGARQVALFSQSWPVSVERKLFPALAQDAFLVAELKSPSTTPLPAGPAQLFVGADPVGHAQLQLVSPGESFTLPLGLDRALKPVRNVELVTAEKGFIGKDDVSRYVVTTELANPYRVPVAVKIFDQWPRTDDEHVEVELVSTTPWAKQDPVKGSLEWDLTLPPAQKTTVSFTYTIRRPKHWRLHQK
jgi:hypothetical protein